jgi:predicted nuclease with TOPRIM domain
MVMAFRNHSHNRLLSILLLALLAVQLGFAGVSRAIQERYRRNYENKALFLKIPVFSEKQYVYISGQSIRADQGTGTARYKVGDQLRVVGIDFGGDEIKFKMGAIAGPSVIEVIFKFDSSLQDAFPNSDVFDRALQATFTEGLKYTDLEDAKRSYVEDQFERTVREMATAAGSSRETVLKNIAPHLPAYQDALRDIENLKGRNQDISTQLSQSQSENRRLETELRSQTGEVSRLRSANTTLQEKIDSSTSQLSKLGDELRNARGLTQGYQKELANLQRSLNIKIDASRELAQQIAELGQAMRKLQKDNENLESQIGNLRTDLEAQQSANTKLSRENDDLKASNRQMKETIDTLTSKEDSLARQYIDLKKVKESLEDIALSVDNLSTRVVEDKTEGGMAFGKVNVSLKNIPLGALDWQIPSNLSPDEELSAEVNFTTESIDYVKVSPDERHILRSLGDRMRVKVRLSSPAETMEVKPEKGETQQEVGERDRATWHWRIHNSGTQDTRLILTLHLVNKNSDEVPVFQNEHLVMSSSVVRKVRNYLQPVPIVTGIIVGFLLFGILGIFRRGRSLHGTRKAATVRSAGPGPYVDQKQL